jgi:hypothetical protein
MHDAKKESKKFINLTWQQIVYAVVGLILIGAVSFVGSSLNRALEKVNQHDIDLVRVNSTLGNTTATVSISVKDLETLKGDVIKLQQRVDDLLPKGGPR